MQSLICEKLFFVICKQFERPKGKIVKKNIILPKQCHFSKRSRHNPHTGRTQAILRGSILLQSFSNPPPILLQSSSNPPPILLQPSNAPPMALQYSCNPSPTLENLSIIYRKSIENLSKIYRKSIENLSKIYGSMDLSDMILMTSSCII